MLIHEESDLQHFGKKGMKWGVRKAPKTKEEAEARAERNDKLKGAAKSGGKKALKIATRVGIVSALTAVGLPTAVAAGTMAVAVSVHPEFKTIGQEATKQIMSKIGINPMNEFEIKVSNFKANKAAKQIEVEEKLGIKFHR